MDTKVKITNQRYKSFSPCGLGCLTFSPCGLGCASVSPRGLGSFLIFFLFSVGLFGQSEGKYEVLINPNLKLHFPNMTMTKSNPTNKNMRYYTIEMPALSYPVTGANNGLSMNGTDVRLGGVLLQNTVITSNAQRLTYDLSSITTQNGVSILSNVLSTGTNLNIESSNSATNSTNGIFRVANTSIGLLGTLARFQSNAICVGSGMTILTNGNVGIGTTAPSTLLNVQNTASTSANVALFKSLNGTGGYAVRGESTNSGGATGIFGELGVWDGTRWSGVRGNSGTSNMPAVTGFQTIAGGVSAYFNERVGIGTSTPTTNLHIVSTATSLITAEGNNTNAIIEINNTSASATNYTGIRMNKNGVEQWLIGTSGVNANGDFAIRRPALVPFTILQSNGNVGIGTTAPTSVIHINGSEAGSITNITATTTLNATHHKVLVSNGATNITITLPDALTCLGREYVISRAAGSTGSITIVGTGNQIQALNGTLGATTSIGLHSATGGGLRHSFTAINIGGVGTWVRI
jgi:hypothetical protein